jgi:hypothetical protein
LEAEHAAQGAVPGVDRLLCGLAIEAAREGWDGGRIEIDARSGGEQKRPEAGGSGGELPLGEEIGGAREGIALRSGNARREGRGCGKRGTQCGRYRTGYCGDEE